MAKCKGVTKDGNPCKSEGRPETGGYCFVHWKQEQGQKPDEVRVRFTKVYVNGAVCGGFASANEGEEMTLTQAQLSQIRDDDPYACVVIQ